MVRNTPSPELVRHLRHNGIWARVRRDKGVAVKRWRALPILFEDGEGGTNAMHKRIPASIWSRGKSGGGNYPRDASGLGYDQLQGRKRSSSAADCSVRLQS